MTALDRAWNLSAIDLRAHAIAYGLRGPMELTALVEAVARAIEADEIVAIVEARRAVGK